MVALLRLIAFSFIVSLFLEYQKPNVVYPDFDNFEVKHENDEWQTHFKFTLEEYKLEDFQDEVNKT